MAPRSSRTGRAAMAKTTSSSANPSRRSTVATFRPKPEARMESSAARQAPHPTQQAKAAAFQTKATRRSLLVPDDFGSTAADSLTLHSLEDEKTPWERGSKPNRRNLSQDGKTINRNKSKQEIKKGQPSGQKLAFSKRRWHKGRRSPGSLRWKGKNRAGPFFFWLQRRWMALLQNANAMIAEAMDGAWKLGRRKMEEL